MDCSCLQTRRRQWSSLPPDWGMGHAHGEKDFSVRSAEWCEARLQRFGRPRATAAESVTGQ